MSYANNKGADQPAHPCSMISAFVFLYLDSIIILVSISKILSLYLASVAAQGGLCLTWSQTPKKFSRDVAHRIGRCPHLSSIVVVCRPHSLNIFSETTGPIKVKFHMELLWDGGTKLFKWSRSHDPDGRHPHIW